MDENKNSSNGNGNGSWDRLSPVSIQRRLTITAGGNVTVSVPTKKNNGDFDNEIVDMTDNCRLIVDIKNAAHLYLRFNTGAAPEVASIMPAGTKLPPPPPAKERTDSNKKHKFKKGVGVFVVLVGELGERLGKLELMSDKHYIYNSLGDFNDIAREQASDYPGMVPIAEIIGTKSLTDAFGNPVIEITWGIYDWVERPVELPDQLFSHENPPEEVYYDSNNNSANENFIG